MRSWLASSSPVFVFEASTSRQQAHEVIIDQYPKGLLTYCLIRTLRSLNLQRASYLDVFEGACEVLNEIKA